MKTFFLSLLVIITITVKSQEITREKIDIVEIGNGILENGKAVIKCQKCDNPENYVVSLTEITQPLELFISEKNNYSFTVESKISMNGKFDFIVYKKTTVTISNSK
ncbi:MAG: hypothetical protein HY951_05465 [Bacteroidia bacterium]|nr:hypothetical protein [Bacteroidia bacterium]